MAGDTYPLEFVTQTLDAFGEGGEAEFGWIGEEQISELVDRHGEGRFFD